MSDDADGDEWRFSVDEVGPDDPAAAENGHGEAAVDLSKGDVPDELLDDDAEDGGNVAGTLTSVGPIEPETPSVENAIFVVLGVYVGVFAVATMFAPSLLSSVRNVLLLVGGVLAVALVSFGIFGLLTPDT